jgi:hypothetical protein
LRPITAHRWLAQGEGSDLVKEMGRG